MNININNKITVIGIPENIQIIVEDRYADIMIISKNGRKYIDMIPCAFELVHVVSCDDKGVLTLSFKEGRN